MEDLINNILPPLPDPIKKDDSPINQKVVKIPVAMKEEVGEIQSPIWKKRSKETSNGGGFGINLKSTFADKVNESKEEEKSK